MATRDRVRVTKLSEFLSIDYSSFVYEQKNNNLDFVRKHFAKFISPIVPLVAIALYLAFTKPICMGIRKFFGQSEKESSDRWKSNLKIFAFVHSVALAVYSGWTFYHTFDIVMSATAQIQADPANAGITWFAAFMQANCDVDGHVWDKLDLGAWVFHFYLSKFYEFIDTGIVYLKGEKPIFLQTFHHAGVLIIMWSFVASQNNAMGVCFTVLNSFIHTIMYAYYALSAIGIKLTVIKPLITSLQLTQFITGIAYSTPSYFMETCHTEATWWTQLYANVYTVILVILFAQFSLKNYFKPSKQLGRELSTSFNQSTENLDDAGALIKPKSDGGKKKN